MSEFTVTILDKTTGETVVNKLVQSRSAGAAAGVVLSSLTLVAGRSYEVMTMRKFAPPKYEERYD